MLFVNNMEAKIIKIIRRHGFKFCTFTLMKYEN